MKPELGKTLSKKFTGPIMLWFMIILIFDYKSPLAEPRSYPFWSPQLGNIQLVVLLRQPVIISLGEKHLAIWWQTKKEEKVGTLEKTDVRKTETTNWKEKCMCVCFSQRNAAPILLKIRIQVKGTGMYSSPWIDFQLHLTCLSLL